MNKSQLLFEILSILDDDYVLLKKWDDFPDLVEGQDIDLLVVDKELSTEKLLHKLSFLIGDYYDSIDVDETSDHTHIDLIKNKSLLLRIDLIGKLIYKRFAVQDSLKTKLFIERQKLENNPIGIFTPSKRFDLLIRYLEYLEWFEVRPDKIKHLDFVLANSSEGELTQLSSDLHNFLRYEHKSWDGKPQSDYHGLSIIKNKIKENYKRFKNKAIYILKKLRDVFS